MKYFDAFAGIGGFALGIEKAYSRLDRNGNKILSISARREKVDCARVGNQQNERLCDGSNQSTQVGNLEWQHQREESEQEERAQGREWTAGERDQLIRTSDRTAPFCIGYSEIDKYASSVYERHFGGHRAYGDITAINTNDIPDFELLVGGFPCQAFSIAGKRRGFEDTRGTLFFELARILQDKKPGYFCFENVKGLLSHDAGRTFKTIIAALDELGYDLQWEVLNSKHHGVPQNRERVFIVGNLRDRPRPEVFPIGDGETENIVVPTITEVYNKSRANGGYIGNGAEEIKTKVRRLTPLECERLQGFPDDWTKNGNDGETISDTQRYKMCGNAVTVNVIEAIFVRFFDSLIGAAQ